MELSAKIVIKQKTIKDILSFMSNTTKELTIYVSKRPTNSVAFFSQLDGVKLELIVRNEFFLDFIMTSQAEEIWLNTYLNGILDVVNSFGKNDELELTIRSDGMHIKSRDEDIRAKIDSVASLPNHYFVVDDPSWIIHTSAQISNITKFFKAVGLFINQERTLMEIDVAGSDIMLAGSSLECSFQHVFKRDDNNVVNLPKLTLSALVVNRFRNIKNLAASLILHLVESTDRSYMMVLRSKESKLGLIIRIIMPLKTKLL